MEKETEFGNTFLPTHLKLFIPYSKNVFPGDSVVKNPPANAGGSGDVDLIPKSGRSLEEEMATHSSILARNIQWTEEPGRLQSVGLQRVGHN